MPTRYYNLDFLKVLAAIFITNSHFIPLYKDISPSLATFGVHGNALFFFVSGFLLMMGFEKKKKYLLTGIRKEYKDYGLPFICHFSIMIMGGMTYLYKDKIEIKSLWKDCLWTIFWFALYFIILYIGKGKQDYKYYFQIVGLLPLHLFIFYAYKTASYHWCTTLFQSSRWKWLLLIISNLTLEIYIVQFHIITDKFNFLFPFNTIIVFTLIYTAAYILKMITSLFIQFLSPVPFDLKKAININ